MADFGSKDVFFGGFWGLICIEKWSQNFDSSIRSAIFCTPKSGDIEIGTSGARIKIVRPYTKGFWIIFPSYRNFGSKMFGGKCVDLFNEKDLSCCEGIII